MGWSISDLIQFTQDLIGSETSNEYAMDSTSGEFIYNDDGEQASCQQASCQQASNLSVDEARQLFDEYEKILRA